MSLPQPKVSLTGACSVIYNNTLYEFSPEGFQSLELVDGAKWKQLASGQSVEGGVCVGSTPADSSQAGLFVVGGTSSNTNFQGLQKFTYSTGKWESLAPTVSVTQDRRYHSATYLNQSDSILVYAGAQDGSEHISSQTFTIQTTAPYSVLSYQSTISPPTIAPILMPWSETQAVMIGGDTTNDKVMLFDTSAGWTDSGSTLADPLAKNISEVKAVIYNGDDGSKHLYTFDLSTSPNTVNRTVIMGAAGAPVVKATPVSKRDLSLGNWPEYNSTLAPTATRSDYSLATDFNGLVVMAGGDDHDVLCIFNGKENSWSNATALLGSKEVSIESLSTSSSSSSSSTRTATSSTPTVTGLSSQSAVATAATTVAAAAASSSSPSELSPTTILGIALGVIFGVALILIALLFLVKRKRQNRTYVQRAAHSQGPSPMLDSDEKVYPTQEVADVQATTGRFRGHTKHESHGSFSSVAILIGKAQKPGFNDGKDIKGSSGGDVFHKPLKATIGRPQPQPVSDSDFTPRDEKAVAFTADTQQPKPRTGPTLNRDGERRSSGWNRYWSGGSTLNALGFGGYAKRETQVSETSHYSDPHRMTQDSATVPPLQLDYPLPPMNGQPGFNRVNSGSPTVSHYTDKLGEGMSGTIERPVSDASSLGYSSGIPPSVQEVWDPNIAKEPWGSNRAPSSAYSASIYPTGLGTPGQPGQRVTQLPVLPSGISSQPQLDKAATSSDMSWLNLGERRQQNQQFH